MSKHLAEEDTAPRPGPSGNEVALHIYVDGVDVRTARDWADVLGGTIQQEESALRAVPPVEVVSPPGQDGRPLNLLFLGGVDTQRLAGALKPPYDACLEIVGPPTPVAHDLIRSFLAKGLPVPGVSISLTSLTAYRIKLSTGLAEALATRFHLEDTLVRDIKSALQEAIANAVIHGNLQVDARWKPKLESFNSYVDVLQQALASPHSTGTRVNIRILCAEDFIRCEVRDEGGGYPDADDPHTTPPDPNSPQGRGLNIINILSDAVEIKDNGRCIDMTFLRREE